MKEYLAVDIGASSGRVLAGSVKAGKIELRETARFANGQVRLRGHDCWDIDGLVASIKSALDAALETGEIASIGIDTWGVDFVLLDEHGARVGDAVAYRDARTKGADEELARAGISFDELYRRTGIQKTPFNTIYQLWALKKEHPEELARAAHFLTIPEYIVYRLTGRLVHEYTDSSTTALLDVVRRDWDFELIDRLGLPRRLFGPLEMPGVRVGEYRGVPVTLVAMHDTGSAYLAVPARDDKAVYLSSGTWSLLGVERSRPLVNAAAQAANFTNEGGAWGRYRFLKNIMGLWMIQSIRRELEGESYVVGKENAATRAALARLTDAADGRPWGFAELSEAARAAGRPTTEIDVDDARFLNPPSMMGEVLAAAAARDYVPKTVGEVAALVYHSLANSYARAVKGLSALTGVTYTSINIVGGGSRDALLNEWTAQSTGLEAVTGPVEATALGNLIVQMIAAGEFASLDAARRALL